MIWLHCSARRDQMARCFAVCCSALGLRCCARRDCRFVALLHAAVGLARAAAPDEIAWYVVLLYTAVGWVCQCALALDENAWYVALLHAAGGWACATAPDESAWYVDLLHAAVGWACAAAPEGINWYVALLSAASGWACAAAMLHSTRSHGTLLCYTLPSSLCGIRRAAPCWPVESLALLNIAAAQADHLSCCNGCCTANLHRWP